MTPADRWLGRAQALKSAGDWRRLLGLARRARQLGLATPELATLGAEAALYLGRPKLARRILRGAADGANQELSFQIAHLHGVALFELGCVEIAAFCFQELLAESTRRGDAPGEARAAQNLGAVASLRGQNGAALHWYRHSMVAYRRARDEAGEAEVLHSLAVVSRDSGDHARAARYARRAERIARALGDGRLTGMAGGLMAEISLRQADPQEAATRALAAARAFREVGDGPGEADALKSLGRCLSGWGYEAASQLCLERAGWLAQSSGNEVLEAEIERVFEEGAIRKQGEVLNAKNLA